MKNHLIALVIVTLAALPARAEATPEATLAQVNAAAYRCQTLVLAATRTSGLMAKVDGGSPIEMAIVEQPIRNTTLYLYEEVDKVCPASTALAVKTLLRTRWETWKIQQGK
jgi:hypothetical protein